MVAETGTLGLMRRGLFGLFPDIQTGRYGGVEQSGQLAWHALGEFTRTRHEPATLFCYGVDTPAGNTPEYIGARTKTQAIWRVLRARTQPRVVVVWHAGLLKLVPFLRAGPAQLVVFLHGIEAWRQQDAVTRRLLPRVSLFLSNSAYTYERFLEIAPEVHSTPYRVVALGIGSPALSTQVPDTGPRALMLSRLERGEDYKGHREVIAAWRGVRAQIPGAELWVAGDGNLRGELEMLTRECGVADAVRFLGRVSETQKQELLAACRCFVMPSRGEGFGLVYLEAMRAGRPCLVGDNDGGREPVNPPEAGLEVNPSDPAQVERNLVQLLRGGDEWSAWSSQARARYEAQFTAAHFERRLTTAVAELW